MRLKTLAVSGRAYPKLSKTIVEKVTEALSAKDRSSIKKVLGKLPLFSKGNYLGGQSENTPRENAIRYAKLNKCNVAAGYIVYKDIDTDSLRADFHFFNIENGVVIDTTNGFSWGPTTYYLGVLISDLESKTEKFKKNFLDDAWLKRAIDDSNRIMLELVEASSVRLTINKY